MNVAYRRNELLQNRMLPVDIVLGPAWWHHHEAVTFDEDFFYHPARRVEVERRMEKALHERWGRFGLGENHDRDLPVLGAVHWRRDTSSPRCSAAASSTLKMRPRR